MMNLMHWRLMVAVADAGNVTRAAERYGITQSGASQAITQMEDTLGVKLFVRERRTTTVTAIGQQVVEHARRMLTELEAIQALTRTSRNLPHRQVRLASFPSIFTQWLPPILQAFERLHPHVEVVALSGTDDEVLQWLGCGSVDIGVVLNPATDSDAVLLGQDRWVVAAPLSWRSSLLTSTRSVALESIVDQPFIVATGGCHMHAQTIVSQAGLRLSDVRMTVSDWVTAYALIEAGTGMAIVPESTLPQNLSGLQIMELARPVYRTFGLVCADQASATAPVKALLDVAREALAVRDASAATPVFGAS